MVARRRYCLRSAIKHVVGVLQPPVAGFVPIPTCDAVERLEPADDRADPVGALSLLFVETLHDYGLEVLRDPPVRTGRGIPRIYPPMLNEDRVDVLALEHRLSGQEEVAEPLSELNEPYLLGKDTAWRARIAVALGEYDRAITLLRQALSEGLVQYPWGWRNERFHAIWLDADFFFHPIRHLPEYQALMKPAG